ncbi:MAG: pyridoxamine 5'-phosphate oxidase family protein [Acidobacteriota bacterium]
MEGNAEDRKVHLEGDDAIAKVRALLPKFHSAMMVTHAGTGDVHVRPLALQGDTSTFGGVLWFFTDVRSRKVQESSNRSPVSLTFQSDGDSAYLHLVGTATVTHDIPKMRELYSPLLRTWFPEGLDDPFLTLMKFEASGGAYWESPGGMLQVLASFAKASLTGKPSGGGEAGEFRI